MRFTFRISTYVTPTIALMASLSHAAEQPNWTVGDRWTYRAFDMWTKRESSTLERLVTKAAPDETIVKTIEGGVTVEETVDPTGKHTRGAVGLSPAFSHTPIKFPLGVGSSWKTQTNYLSARGEINRKSLACNATQTERLVLDSGTYETFKIECSGNWVSPGGQQGRHEFKGWYAPSVRWFVRWQERNWRDFSGGGGLDAQTEYTLNTFQVTQ